MRLQRFLTGFGLVWAAWLLLGCGVRELALEPNTKIIPADGKREVAFRVTGLDAFGQRVDVTSQSTITITGDGADTRDAAAWKEHKFRIQKTGTFTFQAQLGDQTTTSVQIRALDEKSYVYEMLREVYFWSDQIPELDPQTFASPQEILEKLRFDKAKGGQDRWSYIANLQSHNSFDQKGEYVGVGFSMAYDGKGQLRVSLTHADSPAGKAGLHRGQLILSINGKTVKEIEEGNLWGTIFGEPSTGVVVEMQVQEDGAPAQDISFEKGTIHVRSVFTSKIFERGGKKIAYMLFNQFIEPSVEELNEAFASYQAAGVEEMILDLRYNGGGRLSTAHHLGSLLMGRETSEKIFFQYIHNEKNKAWNNAVPFSVGKQGALSLNRLFFIAMRGTASASEVLINGFRPHMPVKVIGETTHGKPMGMYVYDFFDKVFAPISFKLANADGAGEFFEGIKPDVEVFDDVTKRFGDPEEGPLRKALEEIAGPSGQSKLPLRVQLAPTKSIPMHGLRRLIGAF
ncbi:MAG: hypothetical protein H6728_10085 [Myxococcales bacterium]|nr:hypothetical protein [Myxococcales bacterium]MCB9643411.1 hypothetical protein [Myxococcales bacterium]